MKIKLKTSRSASLLAILIGFSLVKQWISAQSIKPAPPVTLQWDPSPSADVSSYVLCYGTVRGNYTHNKTVPGSVNAIEISNLTPNTVYYFVVAARDSAGYQSDFSNEIIFVNQPAPIVNLNPWATPSPWTTPAPDAPSWPGATLSPDSPSWPATAFLPGADSWPSPLDFPLKKSSISYPSLPEEFVVSTATGVGMEPGGSGGTEDSTNEPYYIMGVEPSLTLRREGGAMNFTVNGLLSASVSVETTSDISNPRSWRALANVKLETPTSGTSTPASIRTRREDLLFQAFSPARETIYLPAPSGTGSAFYRVTMVDSVPVLADQVLRKKGFTTHLVVVRMAGGSGREFCHVAGPESYIDYDERSAIVSVGSSGGSIRDVASRFASRLGMDWTSASQFVYVDGARKILATVEKAASPQLDPSFVTVSSAASPSQVKAEF
ncbi:MAG: fibronectin type III domain-containing protein [Verrucomicrobia bacterium]|nr:fibronectin type III domain-containing protein [Verrucomicrobiota bacterium]